MRLELFVFNTFMLERWLLVDGNLGHVFTAVAAPSE